MIGTRRCAIEAAASARFDLAGKLLAERRAEAHIAAGSRGRGHARSRRRQHTDRFYVIDAVVDGVVRSRTLQFVVFPDVPKRFDLPDANVSVEEIGAGRFLLSADAPAFYVRPEAEGHSRPFRRCELPAAAGRTAHVTFKPEAGVAMPKAADLTVHHLGATYR